MATSPREMRARTAKGGLSRPHRHATAPVAPARSVNASAAGLPQVSPPADSAVGEEVACMARPPPRAARRRRGPAGARVVGIPRGKRRGTEG
jgi:hypothetical protein